MTEVKKPTREPDYVSTRRKCCYWWTEMVRGYHGMLLCSKLSWDSTTQSLYIVNTGECIKLHDEAQSEYMKYLGMMTVT